MRKLIALAAALVLAALAAGAALPPPNLERALATQRALLAKQPTAEHANDLGNLLQLAGRAADARVAYERALELDAKLISAHYNLGLLLHQAGEPRAALRHFRAVVDEAPDHAWAWFQIGMLHEGAGAEDAAVRAYGRAYLLEPRLSFADENPQVLDSRLTTRALLRAQRGLSPAAEAPLVYSQPRRIAGLLLPSPPPPDAAPSTAAGEAPPPAAVARRPLPAAAGSATAEAGGGQVLGPQDLEPGSRVGEVSGAGVGGTVTHLPPNAPAADYSELLRQRLLQQQQQQYDDQDQTIVVDEEAPPAQPGGFMPDFRSTGQLDYRLGDQLAALTP